jgi:hypothetical protein
MTGDGLCCGFDERCFGVGIRQIGTADHERRALHDFSLKSEVA